MKLWFVLTTTCWVKLLLLKLCINWLNRMGNPGGLDWRWLRTYITSACNNHMHCMRLLIGCAYGICVTWNKKNFSKNQEYYDRKKKTKLIQKWSFQIIGRRSFWRRRDEFKKACMRNRWSDVSSSGFVKTVSKHRVKLWIFVQLPTSPFQKPIDQNTRKSLNCKAKKNKDRKKRVRWKMRGNLHIATILVVLLIHAALHNTPVDGGEFIGDYSKLSGIIIPGFASTQLRAWSFLDCPYSPLNFNPLDLVWLDTTKVSINNHALFSFS